MLIKKKICMLGAFAVGKTSLVQRFVESIFSERYFTTVGVKIDKKTVEIDDQKIDLILWDIHGEDEFQTVRPAYLRGAAGYLLVVDGTRRDTLDTAFVLKERIEQDIGYIPFILVFNKSDLDEWEIDKEIMKKLAEDGFSVAMTSAKTGQGVEDVFLAISEAILEG